jgi:hypothetical protein
MQGGLPILAALGLGAIRLPLRHFLMARPVVSGAKDEFGSCGRRQPPLVDWR